MLTVLSKRQHLLIFRRLVEETDNQTFINPDTSKEWWVEIEGYNVKSCLNNGKIKELICKSDYDVKNKTSQIIMEKIRKGFIYQNPKAIFGEVKSYCFFVIIGNKGRQVIRLCLCSLCVGKLP